MRIWSDLRDEEMQSFQLPLILDLIVLSTHSGPLFPSSAVVNYVHWKSIDSCSRSLGNVWTNEEERRSDPDCKKKGLRGGGRAGRFILYTFSIFKFIVDTDMQEPNGERESQKGVWPQHSNSLPKFPLISNLPSWQLPDLIYGKWREEQKIMLQLAVVQVNKQNC